MTDSNLLRQAIVGAGYQYGKFASEIGLSRHGFLKKLNNESEFKISEMVNICRVLNLDMDTREKIFFKKEVEEMGT
jgi:DNA-binding phage protein